MRCLKLSVAGVQIFVLTDRMFLLMKKNIHTSLLKIFRLFWRAFMDKLSPVYTLNNECQDCYKCVRRCPVKAIKIQEGHACVLPSRCIACGKCVAPCPSHAKRVRSDIEEVKTLLQASHKVYISLAPSWRAAFSCTLEDLALTFKELGFAGLSETALGAEQVSIETAKILNQASRGLFISSACPVIVDYIHLYKPEMVPYIVPLASPAQTHARLLKKQLGEDISVVFIGPCIAKKNEADSNPDLIAAALTFEEVKVWFKQEDIDIQEANAQISEGIVGQAHEGALYPLDGGMNKTIELIGVKKDVQLTQVSSLHLFFKTLNEVNVNTLQKPLFIEALACAGGCVNGPCLASDEAHFNNVSNILGNIRYRDCVPQTSEVVLEKQFARKAVQKSEYTLEQIKDALKKIGKYVPEDEINCAGCGYQTCRELAKALLDGDAEPSMCVSYMRQIATKQVAAMLKSMPSAMFVLDKNFKILETNEAFIKEFCAENKNEFLANPKAMLNLDINLFVSWNNIFKEALASNQEVHKEHLKFQNKIYDLHVFPIEAGESLGVIASNVTQAQSAHEYVAKQAREVINKNIATVQQIACLLGEHMVETESLLSAIAADYDTKED